MYVNGEQGYRLRKTCPVGLIAIQTVMLITTLSGLGNESPNGAACGWVRG